MRKSVLRVVAMLLASVLFISELNVTAFAGEISEEGEITLETVYTDNSEEIAADEEGEINLEVEDSLSESEILPDDESDEEVEELEEDAEVDEQSEDVIEPEILEGIATLCAEDGEPYTEGDFILMNSGTGKYLVGLSSTGKTKSTLTVPDGVTLIASFTTNGVTTGAFDGSRATTINLPDSLSLIYNRAFAGCSKLTSITIPEKVVYIGTEAFHNCSSLKTVTINSNNLVLDGTGSTNPNSVLYQSADEIFAGCAISNVYFGSDVTRVAANLFKGAGFSNCSIAFPAQIAEIGDSAFDLEANVSSSLSQISFEPGSCLETIGYKAFYDSNAYLYCDQEEWGLTTPTVTFPNTLKSIGAYAFYGCRLNKLALNIPNGCKSIGGYAFNHMTKGDYTTDDYFTKVFVPESVTSLAQYAFPVFFISRNCGSPTHYYYNEKSDAGNFFKSGSWVSPLDWLTCPNMADYVHNIYHIKYVLNGGVNNTFNPTNWGYNYNVFLLDPSKDGAVFDGWYLDSGFHNKITSTWDLDKYENVTVYAKWKGASYTVTYDVNDPDAYLPDDADTSFVVEYGTAYPYLETPEKIGYSFDGWFTDPEDGTKVTGNKTKYTINGDSTLYAHWSPITYKVKLHSNIPSAKAETETLIFTYNEVDKIENEFSYPGNMLIEWNTEADGSGSKYPVSDDGIAYNDNKPWNLTDTQGDTVDLYAIWKEAEYKITFNYDGGSRKSDCPESITIKYNKSYHSGLLNGKKWPDGDYAPTRSGYIFLGWYDEDNVEVNEFTLNMMERNNELKAYWKETPKPAKPQFLIKQPNDADFVEAGQSLTNAPDGTRVKIVAGTGCKIYFTNNGSTPTMNSEPFGDELEFVGKTSQITLKAVACKDGVLSDVATFAIKNRQPDSSEILGDMFDSANQGDYTEALSGSIASPKADKIPDGFWVTVGIKDDDATVPKLWKEDVSNAADKITVRQSGAAIKFDYLHVYYGNKLLKEKTDYSVAYKNNTKPGTDADTDKKGNPAGPSVIISLKGNYTGKITRYFNIEKAEDDAINISKYFVELEYATIQYSGSSLEPEVMVKPAKKSGIDEVLTGWTDVEDAGDPYDYTVEYYNNINAGKATIVITGVGDYYGVISKTFTIKPYDIKNDEDDRMAPGTGATYQDSLKLYRLADVDFVNAKNGVTPGAWSFKDGTQTLVEGRDFTVKYANNKAVADYDAKKAPSVTITGKGNYTGKYSVPVTYTIKPTQISSCKSLITDVLYQNKAGLKPMLFITDKDGNQLKEKKEYTVKLFYDEDVDVINNKKEVERYKGNELTSKECAKDIVPDGTKMKAEITGIKNFGGTITLDYDYIASATDFDRNGKLDITVTATDVVYADKTGILKPTVTLTQTDESGYKNVLKAGKDYEKNFIYKYAEDTLITRKIKKQTFYYMRHNGDEVSIKEDIIPSGTKMRVVITGKGEYAGHETSAEFYVMPSIASAKFEIKPQTYAGKSVLLNKDDIKITIGKGANAVVLDKWDYEIVSYAKNTGKGKGTVTIKGVGKYIGTKSITFTINAAK